MFESIFKKKAPTHKVEMDFPEIAVEKFHTVKVTKLGRMEDVVKITSSLARVDVLLVQLGDFRELQDLKRAIARIKLASAKYGGEVIGLDDKWLIITTRQAVLER